MNNYRPISVISAVFEGIVYNQRFLLKRSNILSSHQSSFRSLHSAMSTLLEATDNWALNINRGFVNAVVFLDLKKAFDTDNHSILSSNLDLYGIKGNAHALICSYLFNCTQKCSVKGSLSESRSLTLHAVFPKGLYLGHPRTNYYKNRFVSYIVAFLWNSLPSNVKQAASLTSFCNL